MNQTELWFEVNAELVEKSISELLFEGVLTSTSQGSLHTLTTQSGVTYTFEGTVSLWGHVKVKSVHRNDENTFEASQFFLDIQKETGMDDIILGNFFEEMHNTLLADLDLKSKTKTLSVQTLATWNGEKLQSVLKGHPKILLSKGRVGWSASHREKYSPESGETFKLFWIAVRKGLLDRPFEEKLLAESFDERALRSFKEELAKQDISLQNYDLMPVHPWQWDRFIATQFIGEIAQGRIKGLGLYGDEYRPQTSLRTLSNVTRPEKMDIKLPLSVLNTSCVRGLPARYIKIGEKLALRLEEVCSRDEKLTTVRVLKEQGGMIYEHPAYAKIEHAPYRYHEFLGVLWRESALGKLASDEKAVLTGALSHQDHENKSLIGEYIRRSGQTAAAWIKAYFEVTLLPLLHLQNEYGVGLVAHGQNIVLVLKNDFPVGMMLKDFHGDLRLLDKLPVAGSKAFGDFKDTLTNLPAHYLIHDLITGCLISVHRFTSQVLEETGILEERIYYKTMYDVLHSETGASALLRDEFERLLLNKVRFKIGYGDSDERPLPILGSPLKNPLAGFKGVR